MIGLEVVHVLKIFPNLNYVPVENGSIKAQTTRNVNK